MKLKFTSALLFILSIYFHSNAQTFIGSAYYSNDTITAATAGPGNIVITGYVLKLTNDVNYYSKTVINVGGNTKFYTPLKWNGKSVSNGKEYQIEYNTIGADSAFTAYCLLNMQDPTPMYQGPSSYLSIWGGQVTEVIVNGQKRKVITNPDKIIIFANRYGPMLGEIKKCVGK